MDMVEGRKVLVRGHKAMNMIEGQMVLTCLAGLVVSKGNDEA